MNYKFNRIAFPVLSLFLTYCKSADAVNKAESVEKVVNEQYFKLYLGSTRLIYNTGNEKASLLVSNEQDYPILVKSDVYSENKKDKEDFQVIPPLFRLDAGRKTNLKIMYVGDIKLLPKDRESMKWVCVKGIPPKPNDDWLSDESNKKSLTQSQLNLNVRISIDTCIKMFVRPESLYGQTFKPEDIDWKIDGGKIIAKNKTPLFINFSNLTVNGKKIDLKDTAFINPISENKYDLPKDANLDGRVNVSWSILTDLGGESETFKYIVK